MTRVAAMVLLLLGPGMASAAKGEASADPAPRWEFSLTPYVWATAFEGTLEAESATAEVDVSFSDLLDSLDAGVLASFEARRGRLSIVSNLIYLKVSPEGDHPTDPLLPAAPPGSFDVRVAADSLIFELRPSFEVLSLAPFGEADARRVALDLGPAARVWWLDQHLHVKLEPGAPLGPFSRRFDESADWVDFVAAARVRAQLAEKLALVLNGDYGGFDVGSSSHRTWLLGGYFAYRLGEHWDLAAGWRTLELERGALDLEISGPLLGASYRF